MPSSLRNSCPARQVEMKKNIVFAVLSLIILFHLVNNYIWLKLDHLFIYPGFITNTIFHLHNQLVFYQKLKLLLGLDGPFFQKISSFVLLFESGAVGPQHEWPVFAYFVTSLANLFFGMTAFVSRFSNSLFMALSVIFTYLIAKECQNKRTGLIAAFLISFYPAVYGVSRLYDLDFFLIAMTAMVIYFLIRSGNFTRRKYSILSGLALGLGILTKGQIVIFVAGPLIFMFCSILKNAIMKFQGKKEAAHDFKPRYIFNNILIFFVLALGVSFVWWGIHFEEKIAILMNHLFAGYFPDKYNLFGLEFDLWTPRALLFHPLFLVKHVSLPLFLIFCVSLFWLKKKITPDICMVILWILAALFIFTLMSAKWEHYCLSLLPAVAILTGIGVERAGGKIRKVLVFSILAVSLVQFYYISFGWTGGVLKQPSSGINFSSTSIYGALPKKNNYQGILAGFSEKIKAGSREKIAEHKVVNVGIIDVIDAEINGFLISYYLDLYLQDIRIWCLPNEDMIIPHSSDFAKYFSDNIDDFDYIIVINNNRQLSLGSENDFDLPKKFLPGDYYNRIVDNLFNKRRVIEKAVLFPDKKGIYLLSGRALQRNEPS
ncbi:MAG: glycosyltransferase family 39 protein [Candidatus Omnitrophota bacterium]